MKLKIQNFKPIEKQIEAEIWKDNYQTIKGSKITYTLWDYSYAKLGVSIWNQMIWQTVLEIKRVIKSKEEYDRKRNRF